MRRLTGRRGRRVKKRPEQVAVVQHAHPQASVERWARDEHRLGLKPLLRWVWAPKGATVKAPVAPRYEWMDVYACVHPQSGDTRWLLLPPVNTEVFSQALAVFAQERGAGADQQIVLVLDRAGWHCSARLTLPRSASTGSSCRPLLPRCSLPSDSGLSPTSLWSIGSSPLWMSENRCRLSAAGGSWITQRWYTLRPASIGGPLY